MHRNNILEGYNYGFYEPSTLETGTHICSLYDSDEDFLKNLTAFIVDGLKNNEAVAYVGIHTDVNTIITSLAHHVSSISNCLSSGQLQFSTAEESYLKDGCFCGDRMIKLFKENSQTAKDKGFSAYRVTGQLHWSLKTLPLTDALIEYESRVNKEVFTDPFCIGLCHYDMRTYPKEVLNKQIDIHPLCHIANELYHNQFYIPPDLYLSEQREDNIFYQRIIQLKERKRREESVAHLHKQTQEIREFSDLLVHELKGPICSANLLSDILCKDYGSELDEDMRKIVNNINECINIFNNRVKGVNKLNKLNQIIPLLTSIDINNLIESIIDKPQIILKEIGGVINFDKQEIPRINAHKIYLSQLFESLIDNAIKYRKVNESLIITITTRVVDNNKALISIKDNGTGFPPTLAQKIFKPFFRGPKALKIAGNGIGLSICRRIVQRYNGSITASGQEDKGACFEVLFPINEISTGC